MSDKTITQTEAFERMANAEDEYENCPECGEDFRGVDMTRSGDLYFIHEENGATVDGCTHELEGVGGVE